MCQLAQASVFRMGFEGRSSHRCARRGQLTISILLVYKAVEMIYFLPFSKVVRFCECPSARNYPIRGSSSSWNDQCLQCLVHKCPPSCNDAEFWWCCSSLMTPSEWHPIHWGLHSDGKFVVTSGQLWFYLLHLCFLKAATRRPVLK